MNFGDVPSWISAIASVFTLAIAATAAVAAFKQVNEAKRLRIEQAQPFVIVDVEPNESGPPFTDLVIRNTGQTLARDVKFAFSPALRTTRDYERLGPLAHTYILQEGIPTMPPGREYRLMFDNMSDRYGSDLERRYEVEVSYLDTQGNREQLTQIIDLDTLYGYLNINIYGTHHIAKTLRAWAKESGVRSF